MKKSKKRYNLVTKVELVLIAIFIILLLATLLVLIINMTNPANWILILSVLILFVVLVILDRVERDALKTFFLEECSDGKNMYLYENVELQEEIKKNIRKEMGRDFALPIAGVFFEETQKEYYIYAIYRKRGTAVTPKYMEEGMKEDLYEVIQIPILDLSKLGYYIRFAD